MLWSPSLFDPRVKPERGTYDLDRDHPLAPTGGLWLFNEGAGLPTNAVNGAAATISGAMTWGVGAGGTGLSSPTGGTTNNAVCPLAVGIGNDRWAVEATVTLRGTGTQRGILVGLPTGSTSFGVRQNGTTLEAVVWDGTNVVSTLTAVTVPLNVPVHLAATRSANGASGAMVVYYNGVQIATGGAGTETLMTATSAAFSRDDNAARSINGIIHRGSIGRWRPPDQIAWLAAEPYAMLRPLVRRTYSVPGGTAGLLLRRRRRILAA